jgi:hypothetical protein
MVDSSGRDALTRARHREPWRDRAARIGLGTVTLTVLAAVVLAVVYGRSILLLHLIAWLDRETDDSRPLMTVAGWLTAALAPLAVRTFMIDSDEQDSRLGSGGRGGDVAVLSTRARAKSGHGIAPRPASYWLQRTPFALVVVVSILLWPLHGDTGPTQWRANPGGHAFTQGWIASAFTSAIAVVVFLTYSVLRSYSVLRGNRTADPQPLPIWVAIVLPLLGLGVALL